MKIKYSTLLCLLTLLAACDGTTVRDTMGLTHQAPDEFRVVARPPLSVPPEFNLRPPANAGEGTGGATQPASLQAQSLITGGGPAPVELSSGTAATAVQPVAATNIAAGTPDGASSVSETQFLQNAGAPTADGGIRQKLQQDAAAYAPENQTMLDKLQKPTNNEPVVDAAGENARLKGDKVANQPPTAGDTPMSKPEDTGTLGRISDINRMTGAPALKQQAAPYRQRMGTHAEQIDLKAALDALKPAIENYVSSPSPQARSVFALAGRVDDLAEINAVAEAWKGKFRVLVVVGAGGSGLSGKALAMLGHGPRLSAGERSMHVLDNCDAVTMPSLLESLDLAHTCFLVISKSGSTVETLAQVHLILQMLKARNIGSLAERMAVITMRGPSPLATLAAEHGMRQLEHDPELCGRFSVLSAAGLIPAVFMDIDLKALRSGAAWSLQHNLRAGSEAAIGAALQVAMMREHRNINIMMPYAEQLWGLSLWWRQSWAESLGKQSMGATPVVAVGTADQHSQLQLFLDGPDDKFFTLLLTDCAGTGPKMPENILPACLAGRTLGDIVGAHQRATAESLERHGRMLRVFEIMQLDAFSFGALIMHFTLEILFAAALLGVNPFDQPAVEESKRLAHQYLTGK